MRRLAIAGLPTYLLLVALSASTVQGAECAPVAAAFSPGEWIARGINIYRESSDDLTTAVVVGDGGFRLTIDPSGNASGLFHLNGSGAVQSFREGDDGGMDVAWSVDADLSGNGTTVVVHGTKHYSFSGVVDSNPSGDGDEWSGSGSDLWGFGNDVDQDYRSTFSPSEANCNTVFGSLDGPVRYGADSTALFLAVRVPGTSMPDVDIEAELVAILEAAEEVLSMDPIDTDILARFVQDVMAFNGLIASLEYCDFGEQGAGPAWEMLRSVLIHTADRFLGAAASGAYSTVDVVDAMSMLLQGGLLGWRGDECLEPTDDDARSDLFVRFEDILLARLEQAWEIPDQMTRQSEIQVIAGAAYQFGLQRVIAALEGTPDA